MQDKHSIYNDLVTLTKSDFFEERVFTQVPDAWIKVSPIDLEKILILRNEMHASLRKSKDEDPAKHMDFVLNLLNFKKKYCSKYYTMNTFKKEFPKFPPKPIVDLYDYVMGATL